MTPEDLASQAPPETSTPAKTPAPADSSALSWPEPPAAPHSSQEPTTGARRFSSADFEAAAMAVTNRKRAQSRDRLLHSLLRRLALAALIAAIVEAVWLLESFGPVVAAAFVLVAGVV